MERLIIEVDSSANAKLLVALMDSLGFVQSIIHQTPSEKNLQLEEMDWARPGRPATDEEHKNMVSEARVQYHPGEALTLEASRKKTLEKFETWKRTNQL